MQEVYQLAFPNINSSQMIGRPKRKEQIQRGTGEDLSLAQTFLRPQRLCFDFLPRQNSCHLAATEVTPSCHCMLSESRKDANTLQPSFLFNGDEANNRQIF